ncbi:hypothetical protein ACHQM5_029358 [Ranunculus cassubicifolius]
MATVMWLWFVVLLLVFDSFVAKKTFIVRMNHNLKPLMYETHHEWYSACVRSVSSDPSSSLFYTYTSAYHGFAASLDSHQAESLRQDHSVLGVYEDVLYSLHTTRTPKFLGLEKDLRYRGKDRKMKSLDKASMDVIIGVLDTGIWPESKSFDDSGMKSVPSRWRGECESGVDFSPSLCNKKLIGARSFSRGFRAASNSSDANDSPRDKEGHGTHTASTAAGSRVANASLFGFAKGTARGMATGARIAAYKVCWPNGCLSSDILAGMERAILDGVDVLSLSIGGANVPYYEDTIAIGAFAAVERGIFVSCSAGNSGPNGATVNNVAPWITTVGAGTIDRNFPAFVMLGNGKRFSGVSLYSGAGISKPVVLLYNVKNVNASMCLPGFLDPDSVRGRMVLCDRGIIGRAAKGAVVRDAGGLGMILANTAVEGEGLDADSHLIPAVAVGKTVGDVIRAYATSGSNPTAVLSFGRTELNVRPSPIVAASSSRGPNPVTPQISKPDLIAPGVHILAAWSGSAAPTGLASDLRRTQFNIISGTSMSCPHVSGLAALLKAAHPHWSPSAIKSALMTTAYTLDNTKNPLLDAANLTVSTPWAHGSGHVDIHKALDPGLVYDIKSTDYIKFLCSLNYSMAQVKAVVNHPNTTCSQRFADPGQLNYPSFSILFANKRVVKYTRILTNVGPANCVYNVTITGPKEVRVTVKPASLTFRKVGQRLKYIVKFIAERNHRAGGMEFGSVSWRSKQHQVRSPIFYL